MSMSSDLTLDESLAVLLASACADSKAYHHLETLCLCFPGRISGSDALESALDFLVDLGEGSMGLPACHQQPVSGVPHWVRGESDREKCVVEISCPPGDGDKRARPTPNPSKRVLRIMANGMSPGTGEGGVRGELISVATISELEALGARGEVAGRIVLFDWQSYKSYPALSGPFRGNGAASASKVGAKAVLVRSIAPDGSTSGLHTGTINPFPAGVVPIPSACVTQEDAELLSRLLKRGYVLGATVTLPCATLPDRVSRNLVFEIPGVGARAHEVVLIGAHTDSWECHHSACQGAHDDGQGVIVCLEALRLIKDSGLKAARTIRVVLFVDEECRQSGARAYLAGCRDVKDVVVAMETDLGAGPVIGFGFSGSDKGREAVREALGPLSQVSRFKASLGLDGATGRPLCGEPGCVARVDPSWQGYGVDTAPLVLEAGVPGLLLRHEDTWWQADYFHHHHTASDTIDHVDPGLLMLNLQCVLGAAWLLANADVDPRVA